MTARDLRPLPTPSAAETVTLVHTCTSGGGCRCDKPSHLKGPPTGSMCLCARKTAVTATWDCPGDAPVGKGFHVTPLC